MLRISKLTDYALLIMSHLAKQPGSVISTTLLAKDLHLNVPTISKILKILADANMVQSKRGSVGGYQLSRDAKSITIADIIEAMEGQLAMTTCCNVQLRCDIDAFCITRANWQKINHMIQSLLAHFTLLDLLSPMSVPRFLDAK